MKKALINGKIILENEIIENKVLIFDEKILSLDSAPALDSEVIDAKGLYIAPGLIDIHIHGYYGTDVMDATPHSLENMSINLVKNGVTGFLPTTMTMAKKNIVQALENIKNASVTGARILGVHVEGPFINEKYKGAQSARHIIPPDFDLIEPYKDIIRLVTYAPELDTDYIFTKNAVNAGINLSVGHTGADYRDMEQAYNTGARNVTHTFNAMSPLNHREPGAVGGALLLPFYCELIADNIHVNPVLYQFLLDNKGDKLILITDCISGGGMEEGQYELGGHEVIIKDGACRLADGTLAGSILTLNKALRNFKSDTNISLCEVFALASANPAKSINIYNETGGITPGKWADIALFDENFNCYATFIKGKRVYENLALF